MNNKEQEKGDSMHAKINILILILGLAYFNYTNINALHECRLEQIRGSR